MRISPTLSQKTWPQPHPHFFDIKLRGYDASPVERFPSLPMLAERGLYEDVVARGMDELGQLLSSYGVI